MDVTWGAGGTTSDLTPEICNFIQNEIKGNCMMHLTCTNMPSEKVDIALAQAKKFGFKNILALRGDPPEGQKEWKAIEGGFECALDLVKYIRKQYGDYFGITVSGYPEGHPNVRRKIVDDAWKPDKNENPKYYAVQQLRDGSYEGVSEKDWRSELDYLKAKIEAGGQVIITQLFYDAKIFIEWVKAVRKHGISAPILPGIMPIRAYGAFNRMTGFCKTMIPPALKSKLEEFKDDANALYEFGLSYVHSLCEEILNARLDDGAYIVPGLHIYTMNTEKCTIDILAKCKVGWTQQPQLEKVITADRQLILKEEQEKELKKLEKTINFGTKVIDKIRDNERKNTRFVSFEYYPPRTPKGVENLKQSLRRMIGWSPQWMDVTWGAGGTTSDLTPEICNFIQNEIKGNCMMHLTCTNMPSEKVDIALAQAKKFGFKNILALRGDPPEGQKEWKAIEGGFECALDLVKYIRKQYGDYFGITVSGYPEGHPNVRRKIVDDAWKPDKNENPKYYAVQQLRDGSYEGVSEKDWRSELDYLKAKIEAGGQVIITQLFYDAKIFIEWVKAVRKHGISAPILPGIMPIRAYGAFNRMTGFCKTMIPPALKSKLEEFKDDANALYEFGLSYVHSLCEEILNARLDDGAYIVPGLHIYTMNTEKCTIDILAKCKVGWTQQPQLEKVITADRQRILKEEQEKEARKQERLQCLSETTAIDQGLFRAMGSF